MSNFQWQSSDVLITSYNSLLNNKIEDLSKLKAFVENNINVIKGLKVDFLEG